MYKVILSVILLAVLDRFDLGMRGLLYFFRRLAVADPKAWLVLVYFTCWLLECVITRWAIWMETNNPVIMDEENPYSMTKMSSNYMNEDPHKHYDIWFALNLAKTILLFFGWLLYSASKSKNNTVENLYKKPNAATGMMDGTV